MPTALEALGRVLARRVAAVLALALLLGDAAITGTGASSALLLAGLLGAASVAAAIALVRVAVSCGLLRAAIPPLRPDEDVDLPVLVSSSDPDADGHARPRAPGALAPAVAPALRPAA